MKTEPVCIGALTEKAYKVSPDFLIRQAREVMLKKEKTYALVIVEGAIPLGLLMRMDLDRALSQRFGFSVYRNKPVKYIMDPDPLIVESEETIEKAGELAITRSMNKLYNHLIVTHKGLLVGTVSVRMILETLIAIEKSKTVKLEEAYHNLQKALEKVRPLSGILPICSHCKKIRDDRGYWKPLEVYISQHSDAEFSHGICPECAKKYYPEMKLY